MKERAIIFAHYDPEGIVDPYVIALLENLRPYCRTLILVSASGSLHNENEISGLCSHLLVRENSGYDFGSWKEGLSTLLKEERVEGYEEVVFINDSVYGPISPLENLFSWAEKHDYDLWGVTSSAERQHHIQSYCFGIRISAFKNGKFNKVWGAIKPNSDRDASITQCEIQLTQEALRQGLTVGTYIDPNSFSLKQRIASALKLRSTRAKAVIKTLRYALLNKPINPTQLLWQTTVELGSPFIKAELFKRNPERVSHRSIERFLTSRTHYPSTLIRNHITRTYKQKQD
ncbi:rhamnan synthesis F family protein [Marinimicrobium alkaliphilum]|uniref:rhamnan synthesis F family protein n=1 Tax=Marinimicrobium alkaliphilum TaxID=2202654 RepID=UPI000DBAC672|nr:rhamnan synthesis F family protein [Marinimicrobium alkaliphilum]